MDKKTFWQRIKVADNKMAHGILLGIGIGLAIGVALGNWGMGVAIGVGVGTAIGAGWTEQAKHNHKEE